MLKAGAVSYFQQNAAEIVGVLAHGGIIEEGSAAHVALHAIIGCAGAAAGGASCSAGALGASASVVITTLLSQTAGPLDLNGGQAGHLTAESLMFQPYLSDLNEQLSGRAQLSTSQFLAGAAQIYGGDFANGFHATVGAVGDQATLLGQLGLAGYVASKTDGVLPSAADWASNPSAALLSVAGLPAKTIVSLGGAAVSGTGQYLDNLNTIATKFYDGTATPRTGADLMGVGGDVALAWAGEAGLKALQGVASGAAVAKANAVLDLETLGFAEGANAKFVYDAGLNRYRSAETGQFVSKLDLPWPANDGFANSSVQNTQIGMVLDRFGDTDGRFLGVPGSTVSERGMVPRSDGKPYAQYIVLKPFEVRAGDAVGVQDFGAAGGAKQYMPRMTVKELLDLKYLVEIKVGK